MAETAARITVNGTPRELVVPAQELLLDTLRERLGLTGAKRSCDVQVCGTCTVLVDGGPVSSCTFLTCDADGREVLTIEGFSESAEFAEFEREFDRARRASVRLLHARLHAHPEGAPRRRRAPQTATT